MNSRIVRFTIALSLFPFSISAKEFFFDNFLDGDAEDGMPVRWVRSEANPTGSRDASTGTFLFTPDDTGNSMGARVGTLQFEDFSVRTKFQLKNGSFSSVGVSARNDPLSTDGYLAGVLSSSRMMAIVRSHQDGRVVILGSKPFVAPKNSDTFLQFDLFGSSLGLSVWSDNQSRPLEPQLLVVDDTFAQGEVGLFYNPGRTQTQASFGFFEIAPGRIFGDLTGDDTVDVSDIDRLSSAIREGLMNYSFDLNDSGTVDSSDLSYMVARILNTWTGDSNLDGEFNTRDLVSVFQVGHYEDGIERNSAWSQGDWNGDGDFNTGDLVRAFQDGGFEKGPREDVEFVPEPSANAFLFVAFMMLLASSRVSQASNY